MSSDKRLARIVECLQLAYDGKIGKIVTKNDTMEYTTEIYPYKSGMFVLYTIYDSRALLFEYRKLLVFVNDNTSIDILGECDIRNSQSIDTCVTDEFLDAKDCYDVLNEATKSIFFRKKHRIKMEEKINYCKELSRKTIQAIKLKQNNESN